MGINSGHREVVNIVVLGTSSVVGKTLITLALCRWLRSKGKSVAPFKPMSMSSGGSSYHTVLGGEIHVHQAHQALAAKLEPHVDMNPLILKMVGDRLEIIARGVPSPELAEISDAERYKALRVIIVESHGRLTSSFNYIVTEGCGSPVELNIKERDISNFWVAEAFNARCVLVASAEKTGAFASIVGTLSLLTDSERSRVAGFIINKFHGDPGQFADGVRILERKTGIPCLGVIPFLPGIAMIGEDDEAAPAPRTVMSRDAFTEELDRWTDHVIRHLDVPLLEAQVFAGSARTLPVERELGREQAKP
jgi:adenosylcobyric acid synthase